LWLRGESSTITDSHHYSYSSLSGLEKDKKRRNLNTKLRRQERSKDRKAKELLPEAKRIRSKSKSPKRILKSKKSKSTNLKQKRVKILKRNPSSHVSAAKKKQIEKVIKF
jgi:hypothetical protein